LILTASRAVVVVVVVFVGPVSSAVVLEGEGIDSLAESE
jgi:hypothetical protein